MAKEVVHTPVEGTKAHKGYKGGPGHYNGEPGLPQRTHSPNAVPEKTYEGEGHLPKGEQK